MASIKDVAALAGVSPATVSRVLSYLGHTDTICIGDCGLPIPNEAERIDPELAKSVRQVLEVNKAERHIRGGLATREKYLHNRTK